MTALIPQPAALAVDPSRTWRGSRVAVAGGPAAVVGIAMLRRAGIETVGIETASTETADDAAASDPATLTVRIAPVGQPLDLPEPLGVHPGAAPADERYRLTADGATVTIDAAHPAGVLRAFATLTQLLATGRDGDELTLPALTLTDGPRLTWRGLSLDVARRFYAVEDVCTIIDLLALYKLNVLHLHLADDQAWRLEIPTWPELTSHPEPGLEGHYSTADFQRILDYAAARHITVVPELDLPGHCRAALRAYPELPSCASLPPELAAAIGNPVALDPDDPTVRRFVTDVYGHLASLTPGRFLHIGADESWGMPHEKFAEFVRFAVDAVASAGKTAIGWQEAARAGITPPAMVQHWINIDPEELRSEAVASEVPDAVGQFFADGIRTADGDARLAVDAGLRVVLSPTRWAYLDTPYAEASARPRQEAERARLGLPHYPPRTLAAFFDWDPLTVQAEVGAGQVAGVEACIWSETITTPSDLQFLLLPRLPGVAEKGWSQPTTWDGYVPRLAGHGALWDTLGLTWYAADSVPWR